jgi:large subunit ribosomal protein L25
MHEQAERIAASPRTAFGKKARFLRRAGWVPANVFGRGVASVAIQLKAREIEHLLVHTHRSPLLALTVEGSPPATVLVKGVHRKPTTGELYHVDLYRVSMTQHLRMEVPLEFVGEAPAAKVHAAAILRVLDSLEVECLPGDLPGTIVVDLERLAEIDDTLHVGDLELPGGVRAVRDAEEIVAKAMRPTVVEAAAVEGGAPAAAEPPGGAAQAPSAGGEPASSS